VKTVSAIFGKQKSQNWDEGFDVPVIEGYDVEDNGDLIALQESYDDQLRIIQSLHAIDTEVIDFKSEYDSLKESASEYELETFVEEREAVLEASFKDAWEKVKQFFQNLWAKLKSFILTAVRYFDKYFRSSKTFIEKYENDLKKLNLNGFKFKMFEYTNLETNHFTSYKDSREVKKLYDLVFSTATNENLIEELRGAVRSTKETREEYLNGRRGQMFNKSFLTPDEYRRELYAFFRNGAESPEDRKEIPVNIDDVISGLKNTSSLKKNIEELQKVVNKDFAEVLRDVEALRKNLMSAKAGENGTEVANVKGTDGERKDIVLSAENRGLRLEGVRALASMLSGAQDISLTYFRAWREAVMERDRTYRSVVMAAFRYKPNKK
jgi:hypothetical protein